MSLFCSVCPISAFYSYQDILNPLFYKKTEDGIEEHYYGVVITFKVSECDIGKNCIQGNFYFSQGSTVGYITAHSLDYQGNWTMNYRVEFRSKGAYGYNIGAPELDFQAPTSEKNIQIIRVANNGTGFTQAEIQADTEFGYLCKHEGIYRGETPYGEFSWTLTQDGSKDGHGYIVCGPERQSYVTIYPRGLCLPPCPTVNPEDEDYTVTYHGKLDPRRHFIEFYQERSMEIKKNLPLNWLSDLDDEQRTIVDPRSKGKLISFRLGSEPDGFIQSYRVSISNEDGDILETFQISSMQTFHINTSKYAAPNPAAIPGIPEFKWGPDQIGKKIYFILSPPS